MAKSFREQAKSMKKGLINRQKEGHGKIEQRNKFGTVLLKDKFPKGVEAYRVTEGDNELDVIPFIAGKQHPFTEEGVMDYKIEMFTHSNIGPGNEMFVCPFEMYGEPCPICEYMSASRLPKEEWMDIKPTHRVAYLVWVHQGKEEEKGIQVWLIANFLSEEKFDELAKLPRGGGFIPWMDIDKGSSIFFTRKKVGDRNANYTGYRFLERAQALSDSILDKSFALDEVINMRPTYKEIELAFKGKTSTRESSDKDSEDQTGDDVPDYCPNCDETVKECTCDNTCDVCKNDQAECTCGGGDKYDEMDMKALKQYNRAQKLGIKPAGMDEEDFREAVREADTAEEEEETEEESASDGKCPGGGTFGTDIDTLAECGECELWDDCSDEKDRLG